MDDWAYKAQDIDTGEQGSQPGSLKYLVKVGKVVKNEQSSLEPKLRPRGFPNVH